MLQKFKKYQKSHMCTFIILTVETLELIGLHKDDLS